jgi:hypothetical protein
MSERRERKATREQRGVQRAAERRQPTRKELDAGAHRLECDGNHPHPRDGGRCNNNLTVRA